MHGLCRLKKMHGLWRRRSAKFQSLIRPRFSNSRTQQLAFLCRLFFCEAIVNIADSGKSGYSTLKVVERFPNPPDNKAKQVAPLPASLTPSLLDSKKLKAISRVSETGPTGELRPQVLYLIELGMDLDQIKSMARRFPAFAYYSLEGKIKPLVEFLLDLGVPKSEIPNILSRRPQFFATSLSGTIIPNVTFLESLGVDKKQWATDTHRFLCFFCHSRQKVKTTVDFLYELGVSAEIIGKTLTLFPQIVGYSVEDKLRPVAEYFHSLGVDVAVLLSQAPQTFALSMETNLKSVTEFFLERGFSVEEVGSMVSRYGRLYLFNLSKSLMPKWEFFLTMDYPQSDLVKFPQYFSYSLEERIKLRYALMKECGVVLPLSSLLSCTSDVFQKTLKSKLRYALMKECGVVLPLSSLLSCTSDVFQKTLKSKLKKKTR